MKSRKKGKKHFSTLRNCKTYRCYTIPNVKGDSIKKEYSEDTKKSRLSIAKEIVFYILGIFLICGIFILYWTEFFSIQTWPPYLVTLISALGKKWTFAINAGI